MAGAFRAVLGLQREVAADSSNVQVHDGLGAFCGLKEGYVVLVIHEEVLGQYSRAGSVLEDVEAFLQVRISICSIFPDTLTGQLGLSSFIEAGCQGIGFRLANSREAAPAAGVEPFFAVAGSVDMERDQEDLVGAELLADRIDPTAALLQGDILALGNQELDVEAQGGQLLPDAEGEVAVIGVFTEVPVGATFARGVDAVTIVEENLHSCSVKYGHKMKIKCGNNYFPHFPLSLQEMFHRDILYKRHGLETPLKCASRLF